MATTTKIQWADSCVNFWSGCTKVSPGCANCYAEARDARMLQEKVIHWGKNAPRLKSVGAVKQALAMNRKPWICDECGDTGICDKAGKLTTGMCQNCGTTTFHRRRIFSLSLGDWLDYEVPIEWLAEMLDAVRQCQDVVWILCTKRPENFAKRLTEVGKLALDKPGAVFKGTPENDFWWWVRNWLRGEQSPKNVILLASIENQEQAEKRIPELLRIPAACRGLSLEPLLGPVLLPLEQELSGGEISWLIVGGESGPNARPCNVEWIRSLVRQGQAAGAATFVKQFSGKKSGEQGELPDELFNVKQFPSGF